MSGHRGQTTPGCRPSALLWLVVAALASCARAEAVTPPSSTAAGAMMYRLGQRLDGSTVQATRPGLPGVNGRDAACANCHRRSGLGSAEGTVSVPPLTRAQLTSPREDLRLDPATSIAPGYHVGRAAFTDTTLTAAIRTGAVPGGGSLQPWMPRFDLSDDDARDLRAYLDTLPRHAGRGVDDSTVHLATIITADADAATAGTLLAVLHQYAADPYPAVGTPRRMLHPNRMVGYRHDVQRTWQLHEWRLTGPATGWPAQLAAFARAQPVFAVLSGVGGADWKPVHDFCEQEELPCLLPQLDMPPDAENDFYSIYFDRGLALEADLLRDTLKSPGAGRVVIVVGATDTARGAALRLAEALKRAGRRVSLRLVASDSAQGWADAWADTQADDALVLFSRPAVLQAVGALPGAGRVLLSGRLAGFGVAALPAAWRAVIEMTYPAGLPAQTQVAREQARGWLEAHHLAAVADDPTAVDAYVTAAATSAILGMLYDEVVPDLLVERFEDMLDSAVPAGRYPRLSLGQGQRFASKGGYLVRFGADGSVVSHSDWLTPERD